MPDVATKAFWAKCPAESCGHCWPVAYYPMELAEFSRLMQEHHRCPKCGTPGVVAKQYGGVLQPEDDSAARHGASDHLSEPHAPGAIPGGSRVEEP